VLDTHASVDALVKNAGLGFAIPYFHNGQPHDYLPDFIVRLKSDPPTHLILETKGFDPLREVKAAAAARRVAAVNADGRYGVWAYEVTGRVGEIGGILERVTASQLQ
jgi:type III restriction enzyme